MPMRVKCPKCKVVLSVKESLAGKKVNCPKCRYVLSIPNPKAAAAEAGKVSEEAEAAAMAAFTEEPPKQQEDEGPAKQIEFECPWCMEMVKVNADLSGKQTPCPNQECKRIVKVPLLKEAKKKDWRQMDPRIGGGLLKQDNEAQPEGTWSTAQKSRVSTEALEEADAIPVKRVPVTAATWIKRGVVAVVILSVLAGGTFGVMMFTGGKKGLEPLNDALAQVESNSAIKRPAAAEILVGAGEFYTLRKEAKTAQMQFNKARAKIPPGDDNMKPDVERDTALLDLALALIELGGEGKDVANDARLDWGEVKNSLRQTLTLMSSPESKQTALREVGNKLFALKQGDMAVWLASLFSAPPKIVTPVPEKKDDEQGDEKKQPPPPAPPAVRSPLDAQFLAFLVASGDKAGATKIRPPPGPGDKAKDGAEDKEVNIDPVARCGYAEGKARLGDFEGARALANQKGSAMDRLEASMAVAAVAIADKKSEQAKASAKDALDAFVQMRVEGKLPPWQMIQLTRVCARAGLVEEAKKQIIGSMSDKDDKDAKALAQLELLLVQIENSSGPVAATVIDDYIPAKDTLAYNLALTRVARHNIRLGGDVNAVLENADDIQRAFVNIGVALGQMDKPKN